MQCLKAHRDTRSEWVWLELSREIGPRESKLIYSRLTLSVWCATGKEAMQGLYTTNLFPRILKDRADAQEPGWCLTSFILGFLSLGCCFAMRQSFFLCLPISWLERDVWLYFSRAGVSLDFHCSETGEHIWDSSRANFIQDSWSLHQSECQCRGLCGLHVGRVVVLYFGKTSIFVFKISTGISFLGLYISTALSERYGLWSCQVSGVAYRVF